MCAIKHPKVHKLIHYSKHGILVIENSNASLENGYIEIVNSRV